MNKTLILTSGLVLTFAVCCGISFLVMHYFPGFSLVIVGFVLVAVAGSGMTLTLEAYDKNAPSHAGKVKAPLLSEEKIFKDLTGKPHEPIALPEPEVIAPNAIVSVQDQVKATMQNKIIQALQSSRVTVELNGTMDLDGNLTVPDVKFSFTNAPNPTSDKPENRKKKDDEKLHAPRMF